MEGKILQRAELYYIENGLARHVESWEAYKNLCIEKYGYVLDYHERVFKGGKYFPQLGRPIKTWPEEEPETIWANAKMLWAGSFNVDEVLAAGFNLCLGGEWYVNKRKMDECAKKGLGIVFNLWDPLSRNGGDIDGAIELVRKWKGYPAIFAWYFLDEPELKEHATPAKQKEWYDAIKNVDPDHELFAVFTSNPNHPHKNYNPEAFDHGAVDVYPFGAEVHNDPWNGDWRKLLNYCADHWNSETGNIGGMAVLQASYDTQESMRPNGHIAEMLDIFRKHGIGTKKDGYGMYCWTDGCGAGSVGISEDQELLEEVTRVNKEE